MDLRCGLLVPFVWHIFDKKTIQCPAERANKSFERANKIPERANKLSQGANKYFMDKIG